MKEPARMYNLIPVGHVRSPLKDLSAAPHQGRDAGVEAVIEVEPPFLEALDGIEECEKLQILCWLHLSRRNRVKVHPRGDRRNATKGVFATRSPLRPNPLAVYTADLVAVEGNTLRIRGIDAVDGTPVVDIRPHIPRLDD